ncbi:hypothetical protein CYMTET_31497 [Cymbomonas tetramitiformis]|uniref:Uncharacterized protein n=1 Tax=Cymbomonas tetramitiformis TaxID=36881 RepID=A0AAE0FGX2_9CHLO|nr:hypothetical protein CYMTET_31497 [Cymbomonas tetramitiformis]
MENVRPMCQGVAEGTKLLQTNGSTSVRGPHVDNIAEVYAGLLYMRAPRDKTKGGDLDVFKCKSPCKMMPGLTNAKANKAEFADKDIKLMRRVAYSENTLVIFINSMISVHAVTPRPPTQFSRRLVNIVGVLNCRKTACGKGEQRRARRSGARKGG